MDWRTAAYDGFMCVSLVFMALGIMSRGKYMLGIVSGLLIFWLVLFHSNDGGKEDATGPEADSHRNAGHQE